jgi:cyclopropane fatty-acyl-phospholipid synthase-like methyltransferase
MLKLNDFGEYDAVVVFLDSLNYLGNLQQLESFFKEAHKHLNPNGCLLFDVHQELRIVEFQDEFIEEDFVLGVPYQWTIQTIDTNKIQHQLVFYEDILKKHVFTQTIFPIKDILRILEELNFHVDVQMNLGDSATDEKYYIKARKD